MKKLKHLITFEDLYDLHLPVGIFVEIVEGFFISERILGVAQIMYAPKDAEPSEIHKVSPGDIFGKFLNAIPSSVSDRNATVVLLKKAASQDWAVELLPFLQKVEKKARGEWKENEQMLLKLVDRCRRRANRVQALADGADI